MTAVALSDLLGVTRQAVSQYEKDKLTPGVEVFKRISDQLALPPGFFLMDPLPASPTPVFYRSMAAATKTARRRAEQLYSWLREIRGHVQEHVALPALDLPDLVGNRDYRSLSGDDIEDLAKETRRSFGLGDGPISNVVLLLENHGVAVSRIMLDARTLDAFSQWVEEEEASYVVLGADKDSAARSRMDAAHELAHLVLHRSVGPKAVGSAATYKVLESQAHRFAAAFLFPRESFLNEVSKPTLDRFRVLKRRWKVAIAMMAKRAQDLHLVTDAQSTQLWKNLSRRGWRKREPLDDELEPEQPRLLASSIRLMIDNGVATPTDILERLPFGQKTLEDLAGLTPGELAPTRTHAFPLTLRGDDRDSNEPSVADDPRDAEGRGKVLPFRPRRR